MFLGGLFVLSSLVVFVEASNGGTSKSSRDDGETLPQSTVRPLSFAFARPRSTADFLNDAGGGGTCETGGGDMFVASRRASGIICAGR
jgi:hypothetical protein